MSDIPPILPPSRPQLTADAAARTVRAAGVTDAVALLGVRGYYRDTMGRAGTNDRGIYDDAMFVVSVTAFAAFNANTDPSVERPGIAVLERGVWHYKRGLHGISRGNPYPAFVQADEVTVMRDGGKPDTGYFGINIHRGGRNTTSSEGCQTIFPDQWDAFHELARGEMTRHAQMTVPYVLIAELELQR
jgi:lysozyme